MKVQEKAFGIMCVRVSHIILWKLDCNLFLLSGKINKQFQTYTIADDRAIFLFTDGAQAWVGKDFLLKQPQVTDVTLEGRKFPGLAAKPEGKEEL